ncbi:energy transducer TonB [Polymorphobacter fuscus]|uniref:TonB family protein n=1 Tax=Sandarakinorhabdus fusca TaxID=1439888 RepID=A0A7C9GPT0_9SPHN|nr:energy transducer TonB [Polymorphobacter fuscus]KAB7647679.1 energy transducer TonB [Polymorphobacter fuscus]MQT16970.1 TonB family protein [Polymorphobacter fuscus]NJC09040.1 protein TonB [Polymorphobacter fuscus]
MAFHSTRSDRAKAAILTLLLQGGLFYALLIGLAGDPAVRTPEPAMVAITLPDLPAPPPPPPARRAPRPQGAAAPPNRVAKATPIVIPPPVIPVIVLPPVVAAPVAGLAADSDAGAAPVAGPGSGGGGAGSGTGVGADGDGDGGGGTHARWLKGRISSGDYPRAAVEAGLGGQLVARYTIGANGRVLRCDVVESSGSAVLDETTCALVVKRFRYRPARDAAGRAVGDVVYEDHNWVFERRVEREE